MRATTALERRAAGVRSTIARTPATGAVVTASLSGVGMGIIECMDTTPRDPEHTAPKTMVKSWDAFSRLHDLRKFERPREAIWRVNHHENLVYPDLGR